MNTYPKDNNKLEIDPDLELDPEALGEDEDLDENELVTPSGS